MTINSPSPMQFVDNQEMLKMELDTQFDEILAQQLDSQNVIEVDNQEYDPAHEDALIILEVFRNKSTSFIHSPFLGFYPPRKWRS